MAIFTIQAPDGRQIKIEAADEATAMRGAQEWASQNPKQPEAAEPDVPTLQRQLQAAETRYSQLPRRQQEAVARAERGAVDSAVRTATRGLPFIGSFGDEINARIAAAAGGYIGGSQAGSYNERLEDNLAYERAKDRTFDQDRPWTSTGGQIAGGVAGTIAAAPAVVGSSVAAGLGRLALGLGARTLPGAVGRGSLAGLAQGAAAGAGDAQGGFVDRAAGGVVGGGIGSVAGGLLPLAGAGASRMAGIVRNQTTGTPLESLSGGTMRYLRDLADPQVLARQQSELQRLGPNAMLPDVSPEWAGIARGAAARPGTRGPVVEALLDRSRGSNARLQLDLDQALGPATPTDNIMAGFRNSQDALGPRYEQAIQKAAPVDASAAMQTIDGISQHAKGDVARALNQVRDMIMPTQQTPSGPQRVLDSSARGIMNVRQEIDGMIAAAEADPRGRGTAAVLQRIRGDIDGALAQANPEIKILDNAFASLARQSEAATQGGSLLSTGKTAIHPNTLRDQRLGMDPSEQRAMGAGLRSELDRIVGTNGNDARAISRNIRGTEEAGDWNPQKLTQVLGDDQARRMMGAVDREVRFQNTANRIAGGSDTGMTNEFSDFIRRLESPLSIPTGSSQDLTGRVLNATNALTKYLTGSVGQQRAARFAEDIAQIAVSTGGRRDEFVKALRDMGLRQQQVSRAYTIATQAGLVVAREAQEASTRPQPQR